MLYYWNYQFCKWCLNVDRINSDFQRNQVLMLVLIIIFNLLSH
jgi:hypothetical protein